MKYHAILHMHRDILINGVPLEMDTAANESHHKTSKVAAKLTQRNQRTFDRQVTRRLHEFLTMDIAAQEVLHGKKRWEYYDGFLDRNGELVADGTTQEDSSVGSNGADSHTMEQDDYASGAEYSPSGSQGSTRTPPPAPKRRRIAHHRSDSSAASATSLGET